MGANFPKIQIICHFSCFLETGVLPAWELDFRGLSHFCDVLGSPKKSSFCVAAFFSGNSSFTCMAARFSLKIAVLPAWELTLVRFGLTFASILVTFLDTISKKSEFYLHGSSIVLGNCIFTCMGAHFSSIFIVLERSREGKGRKEKRREKNSNQHPT